MATCRVQGGFFDIRTQLAGPPLLPKPSPFNKRVFFLAPNSAHCVSASPTGPIQPLLGLIRGPIQPNLIKNIYNKKINPNTNTNQSTLLSVKSLNSIYHMEETKLRVLHFWTDFYINTTFAPIFTY